MSAIPLSVRLYGENIRRSYPCGCDSSVNQHGIYTHYVHPDCRFDSDKIGAVICGHHMVPFDAPTGTLLNQRKAK